MIDKFSLFPDVASTEAVATDRLFYLLLAISILIILLVLTLIVTFSFRYRRGSKAQRGFASSSELTVLIAPDTAEEVHILAKQWMWKAEHPNGAREINELHVPLDQPIRLVMTSQDAIHSFFVSAFRIKKDVLPGKYTETWFEATEEGERLFCALGCSGCHAAPSAVNAPSLQDVYGGSVALSDGRFVEANDAYIRDSILQPKRGVVAGYKPIMPSFKGSSATTTSSGSPPTSSHCQREESGDDRSRRL